MQLDHIRILYFCKDVPFSFDMGNLHRLDDQHYISSSIDLAHMCSGKATGKSHSICTGAETLFIEANLSPSQHL